MMEKYPSEGDLDLIERLSNVSGVSGAESAVREVVRQEINTLTTNIREDALGNLLVGKDREEDGEALRVMIAAHMDEVGFMITHEDGEGTFRFSKVGGIPDSVLPGKGVLIGRERIPGVIGVKPIHLTKKGKKKQIVSIDQLRIDVGPEQADRIGIGDRVVFATQFKTNGSSMMGKAFDDRLGVAILIELIRRPPRSIDFLAAFTVQEEIGLRGAGVAAHALDPDCSVVLDTTPARDYPLWSEKENIHYNTRLGEGAAIYLADSGTISDRRLVKHFIDTAKEHQIPHQRRQPGGGRTDAAAIHGQRTGIPSISVSVPTRYLHGPVSLARMDDYRATLALLTTALETLPDVLSS